MNRTKVNLDNYKRRNHFLYFLNIEDPFVGVTVNVDVTNIVKACKEKGKSFYISFIHIVAITADEVLEFRHRIIGNDIYEYKETKTSHIEMLDDGTYCYCTLEHNMNLKDYFSYANKQRKMAIKRADIEEEKDLDEMYFITSIPWLHYCGLTQPHGKESNPKISWGKYEKYDEEKIKMPVTVLVHHGLVDGIHIAKFYELLDSNIERISREMKDL